MTTDRCFPFWTGLGLGLLGLLLAVPAAWAQDSTFSARVTYVAGQNAYIDAGRSRGVTDGDTLVVLDAPERRRLVVVSSSSNESVVTFAGVPFPLTRGDELRLRHIAGPTEGDVATADENATPSDTTAEAPARTLPSPDPAHRSESSADGYGNPRLTGSVSLRFFGSRTATQQGRGTDETIDRRYLTPSASVDARVTQLPGDAVLRINARGSYRRVNNASPIRPEVAVHAYQLSVQKDFGATSVQAGRFYNRYESYSGYWDGLLVHRGDASSGVGLAVGLRPRRSNERPIASTPRVSGFAHYRTDDLGPLDYRVNGSYHEVRPRDARPTHRYVGLTQQVEWGPVSVRQDLQVDQDPAGGWRPSRLLVHAHADPLDWLRVRAHYTRREPYFLHDPTTPFGALRAEVGGGASLLLPRATLGAEVTALQPTGPFESATVYRARFSVPTIVYGVGLYGYGSLRTRTTQDVTLGTVGVSKQVLGARLRLQYQLYRTIERGATITANTGQFRASVPLPGEYFFHTSVRVRRGQLLKSVSVNAGLRWSL